jgi:hypothetical protein
MPAFHYFTADRMSVVSHPSSNGWTIPLKGEQREIVFLLIRSYLEGQHKL